MNTLRSQRSSSVMLPILMFCVAISAFSKNIEFDLGVHKNEKTGVEEGFIYCSNDGSKIAVMFWNITYFFKLHDNVWIQLPNVDEGIIYKSARNLNISHFGWEVTDANQPIFCFDHLGKDCFIEENGQMISYTGTVVSTPEYYRGPSEEHYKDLLIQSVIDNPELAKTKLFKARIYRLFSFSKKEEKAIVSFEDEVMNIVCFTDHSIIPIQIHDYHCPYVACKSGAQFLSQGIFVDFGFDEEKTECGYGRVYQLFDDRGNFKKQIDEVTSDTKIKGQYITDKWLIYGNGTTIKFLNLEEEIQ